MRQGQNPAKMGFPAYQPKRLGLALLAYIPSSDAYFEQSLDILKYQIASIRRSTADLDLMVFDNGSMPEVQDQLRSLQKQGWIDFLILSRVNLGKMGALNWILASLPNEMIGFSDGDVLFRPGWWEETERVFSLFPRAGLVTAQPCLYDVLRGNGQAHLALKDQPEVRCFEGSLAPESVEEYARGTGLSQDQTDGLIKNPVGFVEDVKSGARAVIGASHMEFVLRRETARRLLPLPATLALSRDEDTRLNRSVDELGLLHLSTEQPYVYHMGNRLDEYTLTEIQRMGLDAALKQPAAPKDRGGVTKVSPAKQRGLRILASLSRWSFFRRTLQRLYNFLFEYYAQAK